MRAGKALLRSQKFPAVLPEAFNVPDGYYVGSGPTPSIKNKLVHLSEKYGVAFVAGLVEDKPASGNQKGFNSACLIDASAESAIQLISQKRHHAQPDCAVRDPNGMSFVRGKGFQEALLPFDNQRGYEYNKLLLSKPGGVYCRVSRCPGAAAFPMRYVLLRRYRRAFSGSDRDCLNAPKEPLNKRLQAE